MRTPVLISLIISVLAALWIVSAIVFPPDKSAGTATDSVAAKPTDKLANVRVQTSNATPVIDYAVVTGRTQAHRAVELASEINARVADVMVEEGANVKAGDVLAKLAVEDRAARVEEARRRLGQRRIEYNAAKSLQQKGFNSEIRLAEALAELEAAKAQLKLAEKTLADTKITAPFDGVISEQSIEIGDFVREGDMVFSIVDLNPIEMLGFVSERNIVNVTQGTQIEATFLNGDTHTGNITFIAPAADAETRTFRVKAQMPNEDFSIKDGLTAEMKIPLANIHAHKIASSNLTLNDAGIIGLKILGPDNTAHFKPVRIISTKDGYVSVSGLPEQITFITVGAEFVGDGEVVHPDYVLEDIENPENTAHNDQGIGAPPQ